MVKESSGEVGKCRFNNKSNNKYNNKPTSKCCFQSNRSHFNTKNKKKLHKCSYCNTIVSKVGYLGMCVNCGGIS